MGADMEDSVFVTLTPGAAYAYATDQNAAERVRLLKLYQAACGVEPEKPSAGKSQIPAQPSGSLPALNGDFSSPSAMKHIGKIGFLVSLAIAGIFGIIAAAGTSGRFIAILFGVAAAAIGLFPIMWMLGAIEERLIEIRDLLRGK